MGAYHPLSIRQKLVLAAMLASTTALTMAIGAFILYDRASVRGEIERRLSTQARIVGDNCAAALLFNDPEAAGRTLGALRAEPHVVAAGVYDAEGRPFASWAREGESWAALPAVPGGDGLHPVYRNGSLVVFHPVVFDSARVGTVVMEADLREVEERLRHYAGIVLVVFVASLVAALLISSRLQRRLTRPILDLAETARLVSRDRDYAVRAPGAGTDELGQLVSTFNEMLVQIQARDAELREAHATLEARVAERTQALERELSERRRAEDALRRSQELMAEAQALAHVGNWEWDVRTGALVLSDEMSRLLGLDGDDTVPTWARLIDAVHPEDRAAFEEAVERALAGGAPFSLELRARGQGLPSRLLHVYASVVRDATGRTRRVVGTGQDVTERRAAEAEREQLIRAHAARAEAEAGERRSAFLAEVSTALSASLDYQATLATVARLAVPRLADWCVISLDGESGIAPVAVAHVDTDREQALWALARARPLPLVARGRDLESGAGRAARGALVERAAGPTDLDAVGFQGGMVVPLRAHGETLGFMSLGAARGTRSYAAGDLALASAVAERASIAVENARLYGEAQQANRLKDEFLATLSHELRTPLNAIVGWTELLKGPLDDPTRQRAVETISRNARVQTQLIEDILDVSRIVAGKLRLELDAVDVRAVAEAAADVVRPAAAARGVNLQLDLPGTPLLVTGDAHRLQQVAWNLLSNAVKFTARGGHARVSARREGEDVVLAVRDSGAGIRSAFLPHVFERFRQADSSSTRAHGGLGLGLAIVRHLVEMHGGTVGATSDGEGRGSTFTVRLPQRQAGAVSRPAAPVSAGAARRTLSGTRVLAVDDEEDTRDLIRTALTQAGAVVRTAASAPEALALFREQAPDVLLCDIEMPGEDGYSLIRRIRALDKTAGGDVPAAAFTAYTRPEDALAAREAGFQIHLSKPMQPGDLALMVAELVRPQRVR